MAPVTPDTTDTSNAAAVPAQGTPTPSAASTPPGAGDAAMTGPAPALPIAPPATVGPTVTKGQVMSSGATKPMSTAQKILQAATGGKTTDFVQGDKGPVAVKRDLTGGELAKRVLASLGSVFAAGAGGALAAKQHRPFELAPGTSLGDIQNEGVQQRQKDAQETFNNTQVANEATLRAHKDAMEQQDSIDKHQQMTDIHHAAEQAAALDPQRQQLETAKIQDALGDLRVKNQNQYDKYMAMPGAEVMKDANGKVMDFKDGTAAMAYATANPDVVHGATNGNTKFGVVTVVNPWTGATQLIDYPADRHDAGLELFGALRDADGNPIEGKDGDWIANGTAEAKDYISSHPGTKMGHVVLDPVTKKPTYTTETITPDKGRGIVAGDMTVALTKAQMDDKEAQAAKYASEAKRYEDLNDAKNLYETGNFDKMTNVQKNMYSKMVLNQENDARRVYLAEQANLARVLQTKSADEPEAKAAQKKYDDASDDYQDKKNTYNQLTGNTPGKAFAAKILNTGIGNTPWAAIDKQITDATMSDQDKEQARGILYNSLSPAQQDAAKAFTAAQQNGGKPAAAGAPAAAPVPHKTPANPPATGKVYIYDLQGNPQAVPLEQKAAYLSNPKYKGWTE